MKKLLIALIATLLLVGLAPSAAADAVDPGRPSRLLILNETLYPDGTGADSPFAPYYEWLTLAYG